VAISFSGFAQSLISQMMGGALSNPVEGRLITGPATTRNESGVVFTDDRAMQISAVWACVRIRTQTVATLPLHLYRKTAEGRELVTDHWANDLLRYRPNNMMTPLDFRQAMQAQLVLWGNGYAHIERSGNRVVALTPLRPGSMTPVRRENEVYYEYATSKGTHIFARESILHIKAFGTDGVVGLSPLRYGAQAMGVTVSAEQHAAHSFSSGGRPAGVLTVDRTLSDVQREQIRKIYENVQASDGLYVLEGGTKYQAVALSPDDLQMLETRVFQLSEIARMFGVPSFLLNDSEKSTSWGTGLEQINLGFLTYSLRADIVQWESALNSALFSTKDQKEYFFEHSLEGLLRADTNARSNFYSQMVQNGLLSRNEVRALENFPPVDGADDLTVQVNMTPIDQLAKVGKNAGNQTPPG